MAMTLPVTLHFVGNASVGKTCLFIAYVHDKFGNDYVPAEYKEFPQEYVPTVTGGTTIDDKIDEFPVMVALWDIGGGVCDVKSLS